MVWMDQNPAMGKEGETVLLSLGNPAWRPGAVKRARARVCVCLCTVIRVLSLLQGLEYHRGDPRPTP